MAKDGSHLNGMKLESPLAFVEMHSFEMFYQCALKIN